MSQIEITSNLYLVIGALVAVVLLATLAKTFLREKIEYPYTKRNALFSSAELNFLQVLEQAIEPGQCIHGKVRLEDIISVSGVSGDRRQAARNRIKSRHIDYVICDTESSRIIAGVELDDRSHRSRRAKEIDLFKDKCFQVVGIPLIRFPASSNYSKELVCDELGRLRESSFPSPAEAQGHLQSSVCGT